jgi:hypothetical protein
LDSNKPFARNFISRVPTDKLSNPVLLSFLRCIDDNDFEKVVKDPTKIVRKYFDSMLERRGNDKIY